MSVMPIGPQDAFASGAVGAAGPAGPAGIAAARTDAAPAPGAEFGSMVLDGLDRLEGLTDRADQLAVEAATGRLTNIHDYTIAASEATVATQLTVAVRNKAVEAFNEIMRMQV
jgi:flagellar hook-basal body complex protein FliE